MKKITFILLVLSAFYIGSTSTGCSDKGSTTTPKPIDTTNNDTTTAAATPNKLKIGVVQYNLVTGPESATGQYTASSGKLRILVDGVDDKNGIASFDIILTGKSLKFYTINDGNLEFSCGRGEGIKAEAYSSSNQEMAVNLTEFGPVGGKIKGNFGGKAQNSKTGGSVVVDGGTFEVIRLADK